MPDWKLAWEIGSTYSLTNGADETAHDVTISYVVDGSTQEPIAAPQDVGPGDAITFQTSYAAFHPDMLIKVQWRRPDGEVQSWRHPMPRYD